MSDPDYQLTDLEIDEVFREATKPYDYLQLFRIAKDKGLDKKVDGRVITSQIIERLHDEMLRKAKRTQ